VCQVVSCVCVWVWVCQVVSCSQEQPYCRADVEVLPDAEEVDTWRQDALAVIEGVAQDDVPLEAVMQAVDRVAKAAAVACGQVHMSH
jgi:hypothetical protein